VSVDLAEPRELPARARRNGTTVPPATIQSAALVIKFSHLESRRYARVGSDIFPDYGRGPHRGFGATISAAVHQLRVFRARLGVEPFFIHSVGWLSNVSQGDLAGINPSIVGREAGWLDVLDAAAQQSETLFGPKSYELREAVGIVRDALAAVRPVSPCERRRSDELNRDATAREFVEELAHEVGIRQIRLTGHGGTGKTMTLALLARSLVREGSRVLLVTLDEVRRGELEHRLSMLIDSQDVLGKQIDVTTLDEFVRAWLDALNLETCGQFLINPNHDDVERVKELDPARFDWDSIFIDEAQDVADGERDLLRALYGHTRMVLADGLNQLSRRESPCDWASGIPKVERFLRHLSHSVRASSSIAAFANALARELEVPDWRVSPEHRSSSGDVVVLNGEVDFVELFAGVRKMLAHAGAVPLDALVCVPPELVRTVDGVRRFVGQAALEESGELIWNGIDPAERAIAPTELEAWRIVEYETSSGLEGWVTVALAFDLVSDTSSLLLAATRAIQALVLTVADPRRGMVESVRNALPSAAV
jgi:hypothetical protein